MKLPTILSAAVLAAGIVTPLTGAFAGSATKSMLLYKNPQCGCCEEYANYMRTHGYSVTVIATEEVVAMSRQAGIPEAFEGCHLSLIGKYAVGGHVPLGIVEKLLRERPDVRAISLPGMPAGSPGMGGPKTEPFTVFGFGDGRPRIFAVE